MHTNQKKKRKNTNLLKEKKQRQGKKLGNFYYTFKTRCVQNLFSNVTSKSSSAVTVDPKRSRSDLGTRV